MSFLVQSIPPSHETHRAETLLFCSRIGGALFFQQSSQALAALTCSRMVGKALTIENDDVQCALQSLLNPALRRISCHIVKSLTICLYSDETQRRHNREGMSR